MSQDNQGQPSEPIPLEHQRWQYEQNIENANRVHDIGNDFVKYVNQATIDTSNLALRTLILINGGAAVAVLAFLGAIASKDKADLSQVTHVAATIRWFAFGVASAVLAMGTSYATHYVTVGAAQSLIRTYVHPFFTDGPTTKRWKILRVIFHVASVILAVTALFLFLIGMFKTSNAVTTLVAS